MLFHAQLDRERVQIHADTDTGTFYLKPNDLRMFVNPTDWNLDTTSTLPVLNFLIYVPRSVGVCARACVPACPSYISNA